MLLQTKMNSAVASLKKRGRSEFWFEVGTPCRQRICTVVLTMVAELYESTGLDDLTCVRVFNPAFFWLPPNGPPQPVLLGSPDVNAAAASAVWSQSSAHPIREPGQRVEFNGQPRQILCRAVSEFSSLEFFHLVVAADIGCLEHLF